MLFFRNNNVTKFTKKNYKVKCAMIVKSLLSTYNIQLKICGRRKVKGIYQHKYSLSVGKQMMDIIGKKYKTNDNVDDDNPQNQLIILFLYNY